MNKRIKALAEQAGLYDFVIEPMGIDLEMQQFAELIVKECISELRDTFDITIEEGNHLKEHFGVE